MHSYTAVVQKGIKRGTALGFPTVNIPLNDEKISGIYVGRVQIDTMIYHSAVFASQERKILEAYILDFSGDLYDKEITIELHKKIREAGKFTNDETLKKQIADDISEVRKYFHSF